MKKIFTFLLLLTLLLSACTNPQTENNSDNSVSAEKNIPDVTPLLYPVCGDEVVSPQVCYSDWDDEYADLDIHPLDYYFGNSTFELVLGGPTAAVTLQSKYTAPDSLTVLGWPIPSWGEFDTEAVEFPVVNGEFILRAEWYYLVKARWEVDPGVYKEVHMAFRTTEEDPGERPPSLVLRYDEAKMNIDSYSWFWANSIGDGLAPTETSAKLTTDTDTLDILFDFDGLAPSMVNVKALPMEEADNEDAKWIDVNDYFKSGENARVFRAKAGYIYMVDVFWSASWSVGIGSASYAFHVVSDNG